MRKLLLCLVAGATFLLAACGNGTSGVGSTSSSSTTVTTAKPSGGGGGYAY